MDGCKLQHGPRCACSRNFFVVIARAEQRFQRTVVRSGAFRYYWMPAPRFRGASFAGMTTTR
jgi:hypothetical protein